MNKTIKILMKLKLRPTKQRIAIINVLTCKGNIHITANTLELMLEKNNVKMSTATVYNNLNELSKKGFLKKVLVGKDRMWFDTNLTLHHHFYDEEEDKLSDVNHEEVKFILFPKLPKDKKLKSVDVVINIKKK